MNEDQKYLIEWIGNKLIYSPSVVLEEGYTTYTLGLMLKGMLAQDQASTERR